MLGANTAIPLETHLDVDLHEDTRPTAGEKLFFAAIDQFYRLAGFFCEDRGNQGVVVVAGFAAKSAAHSTLDDAYIRFRHTQRRGDSKARAKQRLCVHVDRVFAVGAVFRDTADGFDRTMPLSHARKGVFDDHVGLSDRLGDVAALDVHYHRDIIRFVIVYERRVVFHCLLDVENTGERLPIHFNQIDSLLGDVEVNGSDSGDFLADIARFTDRKDVLIGEESPPGTFEGVFRRDHGAHAAKL